MKEPDEQSMEPPNDQAKPLETTLEEFFESRPPNVSFIITGETFQPVTPKTEGSPINEWRIYLPAISLWCDSDECKGIRTFDSTPDDELTLQEGSPWFNDVIFVFYCRNCRESEKKYAVSFRYKNANEELIAVKLGEHPPLSVRLPSRLRKLVGTDQDKFNKGLQCEAHGLGVGAFAYYRQILENQKDRLIDQIIKVANLQNVSTELIRDLEQAKRQNQFSTAVGEIKHVIPEILLIDGHNPLTLLHKALSEGLHAGNDAECLEIAQNIRVILSEFSERLHTALKDNRELKTAISRILNPPKKAGKPPPE